MGCAIYHILKESVTDKLCSAVKHFNSNKETLETKQKQMHACFYSHAKNSHVNARRRYRWHFIYIKNTTVQSYKDVSFDQRTGRGGECCVHIGENHICPVNRKQQNGSNRCRTLKRNGWETGFFFSLKLDAPDIRKQDLWSDVTHFSKRLSDFNPVSSGCWRRRSDTTQQEGIVTRQACWQIWPVGRPSPFCKWWGNTLVDINENWDIVSSLLKRRRRRRRCHLMRNKGVQPL